MLTPNEKLPVFSKEGDRDEELILIFNTTPALWAFPQSRVFFCHFKKWKGDKTLSAFPLSAPYFLCKTDKIVQKGGAKMSKNKNNKSYDSKKKQSFDDLKQNQEKNEQKNQYNSERN